MMEVIEYYKKLRKQKMVLILDFINGLFLLIYTLIYSYMFKINIIDYIVGYMVICFIFDISKYIIKLYSIYGLFNKIEFSALFQVKELYNSIVDKENYKNIKLKMDKLKDTQKNAFYNFLKDTKMNYNLYKIWDMALMFGGFAIGASFNEKGVITTELISNTILSALGAVLGMLPFYIIFIKVYNSYNKLLNVNIIKVELINYINEYNYSECKNRFN